MATPSNLDILDSQLNNEDYKKYQSSLGKKKYTFSIVPGQFKQSLSLTDESSFDYLSENLGVIGSWGEVISYLHHLNNGGDERFDSGESGESGEKRGEKRGESFNVSYKLLFLARHGQGFHNLAHTRYGNDAWNDHYSKLNGDGKIVWGPDPELTELGQAQARDNNYAWKKVIELFDESGNSGSELSGLSGDDSYVDLGLSKEKSSELAGPSSNNQKNASLNTSVSPIPTKFFVSPLRRSIDTMIITWSDITSLSLNVTIMENIRETMGVHTCDKRSSKSIIEKKYPNFIIEPGFEEEDIYWKPDYRESVVEHALRINDAFQEIFDSKDEIINITSHSGSIRAQLMVLGHRSFAVGTGGMIPVFVKAVRNEN